MIFFLKLQQKGLEKAITKAGERKKMVLHTTRAESSVIMKTASDGCAMLNYKTRTWGGYALSFVPFTKPFKVRCIAASALSAARKEINVIRHELKKAPLKNAAQRPPKPINKPAPKGDGLGAGQYKSVFKKQAPTTETPAEKFIQSLDNYSYPQLRPVN